MRGAKPPVSRVEQLLAPVAMQFADECRGCKDRGPKRQLPAIWKLLHYF